MRDSRVCIYNEGNEHSIRIETQLLISEDAKCGLKNALPWEP